MLKTKVIGEARTWLVAPILVGLVVASTAASAQPNEKSRQEVDVYAIDWGDPRCSTFALEPMGGNEIKEISNIVLSCAANADGETTWSKWEFSDGTPYEFGTVLPAELEATEGNGCIAPISDAYVKAGSIRTMKGLPGVDKKQFNGYLGGKVACTLGGN